MDDRKVEFVFARVVGRDKTFQWLRTRFEGATLVASKRVEVELVGIWRRVQLVAPPPGERPGAVCFERRR